MPSLIDRTMASLSSGSEVSNRVLTLKAGVMRLDGQITCIALLCSQERSATARSNIGEIVRKLGDRMLQTMVPLLKERLEREEVEFRQGACWAVAEIIRSCTKNVRDTSFNPYFVVWVEFTPAVLSMFPDFQ